MIVRTLKTLHLYCILLDSKFGVAEIHRRAQSFEDLINNRIPKKYHDKWIVATDFETKEKRYNVSNSDLLYRVLAKTGIENMEGDNQETIVK